MPTRQTNKPAQSEPPANNEAPAEDQEPTPEAYEAARTALVAKLPPKANRPITLYGKLALATSLIGQVKKSGRNSFHNYTYAKESDLVEAIRPLLSELGLWIHWTLYAEPEKGIFHHQRVSLAKKRDGDAYEAESMTIVTALFKFYDEKGDCTEPQMMMGYGDDNSDKGLSKALTAMEKYFLFKSFLVSTGDDPEADRKTDERAARRESGYQRPTEVRRSQGAQPAAGGRQTEPSNPQLKQLGELTRAAGIRTITDTIMIYEKIVDPLKIEPLDPDDLPTGLLAWLKAQSPATIGKLIHEVRKLVEAKGGDKPSPAPATAAPAEGTTEKDVDVHSDGEPSTAPTDQTDPDMVADEDVE